MVFKPPYFPSIRNPVFPFWVFLIVLLAEGFGGLPLWAQVPSTRQFSLQDGLPQSEITALFQDRHRVIWVGTRGGGILRMDGYSHRILHPGNEPESSFISDIHQSPDGQILAALTYQGISKWDGQSFQNLFRLSLSEEEMMRVFGDNKRVLGLSNRRVVETTLDSTRPKTLFTFPAKLGEVHACTPAGPDWILVSVDSALWAIHRRFPQKTHRLVRRTHLAGKKVIALSFLANETVYMISSDGHGAFLDQANGRWKAGTWEKLDPIRVQEGEELTNAIFSIGPNFKWVSTNRRRLISNQGEELDLSISVREPVQGISHILLDQNGMLWIGTMGSGLIKKPLQAGSSFRDFPALVDNNLRAVHVSPDGRILAGGSKTGVLVLSPRIFGKPRNLETYFPDQSVHSIFQHGRYFFFGLNQELVQVDAASFRVEGRYPLPARALVYYALPGQRILMGTYGEGVWLLENKKLRRIPQKIPGTFYAYGFERSESGGLYIPTNSGLFHFDPEKDRIDPAPPPDSIKNSFFLSTRDKFGNYWFANADGLTCKWPGGWRKLPYSAGLSSNLLYTLNADSLGHIWVGTNRGLDRITVSKTGTWSEIENFGPEEGYDGYEANMRGSYLHKGSLYICTVQGLFSFPVKSQSLDPLPPAPEITGLRVRFRQGDWIQPISASYLTGLRDQLLTKSPDALSFSFQTINPIYPHRLLYSYRLEGAPDAEWSQPAPERECLILNAGPGRYRFEVRSTYDGKHFSIPARFAFQIEAPWYGQAVWVTIGVLLLGLLIWLISRRIIIAYRDSRQFNQDLDLPEKTAQLILLLFALFYPLAQILAYRFEEQVFIHPVLLAMVSILALVAFLASYFFDGAKRHIQGLVRVSFLFLVADTAHSLFQSQLAPYHAVALLYMSSLSFLVFQTYRQLLAYVTALVLVSLSAYFFIENPHYSPVLLLLGTVGLSAILLVIYMAKRSGEDKFQFANQVVNSGPVLVLGFSPDGTLIFSSQNVLELLGYSVWEVGGRAWWSQIVARNEDVLQLLRQIQSTQETNMKIQLRHKNGAIRFFAFTGRLLNPDLMVLIGQDITEKEALETRFENLVENAPDAIYQTDFYGKLVYANPQTSYILGISNAELVGRNYADFLHPDYKEKVIDFYRDQTQRRLPSSYQEFPILTRTGQVRWLGFQVSLLLSNGGKTIDGYLSIGRDITERLEAEQLIQYQHKNITDSLAYANRIRSAILPGESSLRAIFTHYAVLDQPKDIIGGDFYWYTRFGKKHIFALGDCTGHGVPGAFMTTISVGILREVIKEDTHLNLEEILGLFNRSLTRLMGSNSEIETPDFVELALLEVDFEKNQMSFISSGIGLCRFRKGNLEIFQEGSRGQNFRYDYRGLSKTFPLFPGDVFYLFTDGMFDQIGGPQNKRLNKKRFLEIIRQSNQSSLRQGMEEIRQKVEEWQGQFPQIDDRLIVSFRF